MRRPRSAVAGVALAYVGAWAVAPFVIKGPRTDLDIFFWPAAQYAVHGHLLTVYSFHTSNAYPVANGPLGLVALVPSAVLANAFAWTDPRIVAAMVGVVAGVLALLIAREALQLTRMARGSLEWPLAASAAFVLAPVLWIAVAGFGHLEQLIETYLLLAGARLLLECRVMRAGGLLGLALVTRTAALCCSLPFALGAALRRGRRGVLVLLTTAAVAVALALLPFLLADGQDVGQSLFGFRGQLPISGGSLWVALYRTPLAAVAERSDAHLSLAVGAVLCTGLVRRRPDLPRSAGGLPGLLCIASACFPMLAKTVHSYYLFEPYVFATLWWLSRPGTALNWRIAAPALITADVFLTEWSVTLPLTGIGAVEGVLSSLILAAVIAVVAADLLRSRAPERRPIRGAAAAAR